MCSLSLLLFLGIRFLDILAVSYSDLGRFLALLVIPMTALALSR